jgi:SAM-dependent MidA family methyltransferase
LTAADGPGRAIEAEIAAGGPLRFDRFQELALYSAGGYYERPGRVGRAGDFVTGPSWHPAFGRCVLRFLAGLPGVAPGEAALLDVGAGEGELLAAVHAAAPDGPRLLGVERSATRREAARRAVPSARLLASLAEVAVPISGVVFAYELFDALPVRAFRVAEDGRLVERLVAVDRAGGFRWTDGEAPDGPEIAAALARRGAVLEPGQLLEVRPGAPEMARRLASTLGAGALLVFDYGAPTRALYGPARAGGTLEAFLAHQVTREVLTEPGSRDLTAWVDFGEIAAELRDAGLDVAGPVSQSRFLLANGIASELEAVARSGRTPGEQAVERNALAKLFMPGGMGESIRLLIATRGSSPAASLAAPAQV